MTASRRDFLAALAAGTGAVLMGRGWYRRGSGLVVPDSTTPAVVGFPESFTVGDVIVADAYGTRRILRVTGVQRRNGVIVALAIEAA